MTINRELIETVLRATFPDPMVEITASVIDGAIGAMQRAWQPDFERYFGIPKPVGPLPEIARGDDAEGVRGYYLAIAQHSRIAGPAQHAFEAFLPMVQIALPAEPVDVQTAMGWCYAGDRLMHSLADMREFLEQQILLGLPAPAPDKLERVELLTPPRLGSARFGAIALYVLHPWGCIVEAGMATGQPRVLYWLPTCDEWHVRRSWYQPTPDSSAKNHYAARVRLDASRQPISLEIRRFNERPTHPDTDQPVMRIDARFTRHTQPLIEYPAALTFVAACRVAKIMQSMGKELPDVGFLTPVLAAVADTFDWVKEPTQ